MKLSCMSTSGIFCSGPRIMALLKYFKCIEPSKEERIQNALPKLDCPLALHTPYLCVVNACLKKLQPPPQPFISAGKIIVIASRMA